MPFEMLHFRGSDEIIKQKKMRKDFNNGIEHSPTNFIIYKISTCYLALFEKWHFVGNCHARPPAGGLSGIHLIEIDEIPAKNLRE